MKEKIIEKLKDMQDMGDKDITHMKADDLLCELLVSLGYADVVDEYEKISKWYA